MTKRINSKPTHSRAFIKILATLNHKQLRFQGHTKITSKLPVVTVVKQVHKRAELCPPPQSRLRKVPGMITSVLWQKFLYSGLSLFFFLLLQSQIILSCSYTINNLFCEKNNYKVTNTGITNFLNAIPTK